MVERVKKGETERPERFAVIQSFHATAVPSIHFATLLHSCILLSSVIEDLSCSHISIQQTANNV